MSTVLARWVQMATHCKAKAIGTYCMSTYSIGWLGTDGYHCKAKAIGTYVYSIGWLGTDGYRLLG
jgi:hypothetical protein